jgi:hypothetical protein
VKQRLGKTSDNAWVPVALGIMFDVLSSYLEEGSLFNILHIGEILALTAMALSVCSLAWEMLPSRLQLR